MNPHWGKADSLIETRTFSMIGGFSVSQHFPKYQGVDLFLGKFHIPYALVLKVRLFDMLSHLWSAKSSAKS